MEAETTTSTTRTEHQLMVNDKKASVPDDIIIPTKPPIMKRLKTPPITRRQAFGKKRREKRVHEKGNINVSY